MNYQEAVHQLFYFLRDKEATNFHALLFRLIMKADKDNLWRIELGFPNEVKAHFDWFNSDDEYIFFVKNGVPC